MIDPIPIQNIKAETGSGFLGIKHRYCVVIIIFSLMCFAVAFPCGIIAMMCSTLPSIALVVYAFLIRNKPDCYTRDLMLSLILPRQFNYVNPERYKSWLSSDE